MQEILKNLSKKQQIIIIIILFIIIVGVFIFLYKYFYNNDDNIQVSTKNETEENIQEESTDTENTQNSKIGLLGTSKKVVVHVIGEVNSPGVVTLDEGARIVDAINAAGGKTEEADLSKVNLAYIIEDGVQIYVPRIGEVNTNQENQESYIKENAGEGVITESVTQSEEKNVKVNINTATQEKLQTLPGVGESTAQKIIQYREQNGKFQTIEDLKKVSGIGESKYNNLKEYITV